MRGSSAASPSWKTICTLWRYALQRRAAQRRTSRPSSVDRARVERQRAAGARGRSWSCPSPTRRSARRRTGPAGTVRSTPRRRPAPARSATPRSRTSSIGSLTRRPRARAPRRAARACSGRCGARSTSRRPARCSTIRAVAHDRRPCRQSSPTDGQVVADEQHRVPSLGRAARCSSSSDLGLHGDVERARRLVGDQHLRAQRHRQRDREPLRLAARELVRVAAQQLGRERTASSASAARRRASGSPAPCRRSARSNTVTDPEDADSATRRGLQDHRDPPRRGSRAARARRGRPAPARRASIEPVDAGARCRAPGRAIESAVIDLPDPLSPTSPTISPRSRSSRSTRHHAAARRTQTSRSRTSQLHRLITRLGSSSSRSPSPIRLKASAVSRIARRRRR